MLFRKGFLRKETFKLTAKAQVVMGKQWEEGLACVLRLREKGVEEGNGKSKGYWGKLGTTKLREYQYVSGRIERGSDVK